MRQVCALLGLVRRWGPGRVDAACRRALEAGAVSVPLVSRILQAGTENAARQQALPFPAGQPRLARDPAHFAVRRGGLGGGA